MNKPFAIVTGANCGRWTRIGRDLCEEGFDLLVAADQPEIQAAADRFFDTPHVSARGEAPGKPFEWAPSSWSAGSAGTSSHFRRRQTLFNATERLLRPAPTRGVS